MKRFISLFVSIALFFSVTQPVFAVATECGMVGQKCLGAIQGNSYPDCCRGAPDNLVCKGGTDPLQPGTCTKPSCKAENGACKDYFDCCYAGPNGIRLSCQSGKCKPMDKSCTRTVGASCLGSSPPCCEGAPNYLVCDYKIINTSPQLPGKCVARKPVGAGASPTVPPFTCACTSPGDEYGGNSYKCGYGGPTETRKCPNPSDICKNGAPAAGENYIKTDSGITCLVGVPKINLPPCKQFDAKGKCLAVGSSLGTLATEPGKFITRIFGILLAGSGGIALLLLMRAGYQMMTARGNPEGLQKGREQFISAVVGLVFLIFSFVLLQVIGADLLKIPGFR